MAAKKKASKKVVKEKPGGYTTGRPTAYKKEYCKTIIELGGEGKTSGQWARSIGVAKQTLHDWKDKHSEFLDAFNIATTISEGFWLDRMDDNALTERGNQVSIKWRLAANFRIFDKPTEESTAGPVSVTLNFKEKTERDGTEGKE